MDIDRARQNQYGGYAQTRGKCFRCGQFGHQMAECNARIDIRVAHEEREVEGQEEGIGRENEERQDF